MKKLAIFSMALMALVGASCQKAEEEKAPITKPQITIEGGRLTPEGLWAMGRIGSVKSDIETGLLAYTVSYYSVEENRSTTWIRICNPFENMQVVDEFVGSEPAWFGNSGALAYLKGGKLYIRRDKEEVEVEGTEDIEGFLLSPMRDKIILVKQVKTVPTTADKYPDLPLATGHMHEDLMYKHWDEWTETAPQPFVYELQTEYYGEGERMKSAKLGEGFNILEGTAFESPMKPFGGIEQLAWNPNNEDGYESDENRLMAMNMETGEKRFLSRAMDTNVDEYKWLDDTSLVFTACKQATVQLYRVTLDGWTSKLTEGQHDLGLGDVADYQAYILGHSMRQANEIYHLDIRKEGALEQLTHENDNIYDQIERSTVVPRWQKTTDGKDMLTWIIYPPHFDPAKKYPTILYCEGGPQSPVSQFWSFRWNFMMMSAGDYIIVAPNRRGLPGFGKEWNEEISGDYGGQCMKDYFTAIDEFCTEPYVDKEHLGCVGASFGGFSVYWIAGHHDGRFKAFIAHDGIFNLEMQYLETEEKWFANWDMGGAYWDKDNKIAQRTFENSPHRFVDKWDTPILCIHGEKDYRILANQAMAAFDAAKMRGVPAELLIFPDENHWVLKPQNGILWQREFRGWLDRWLKE